MESGRLFGMGEISGQGAIAIQEQGGESAIIARSVASEVRCRTQRHEAADEAASEARLAAIEAQAYAVAMGTARFTRQAYREGKAIQEAGGESLAYDDGNEGSQLAEEDDCQDVNAASLLALLDRQQRRCALSGRELTPEDVAVDHKTPLKHGLHHHTISNLQLVIEQVNRAKGTMGNDEFIALCCDVADCYRAKVLKSSCQVASGSAPLNRGSLVES